MNFTSGTKTISQNCDITEDNNDDEDGEKKYELECVRQASKYSIYFFTLVEIAIGIWDHILNRILLLLFDF